MSEEIVQIGLVGPNPPEIIGLKQVRANKHGGYDSVGDALLVNLSFQVNGTVFTIQSEQQIPMELFQHLKQGPCQVTAELAPLRVGQTGEQMGTYEISEKLTPEIPTMSDVTKRAVRELKQYGDKRESAFKTRLGTSGKQKFYKALNAEVSWVDIVDLAQKCCGKDCNLSNLYRWAEENIYCISDRGQRVSIGSHISNWQASIRQNRRKAKSSQPNMEAKLPIAMPTADSLNDEISAELDQIGSELDFDDQSSIGYEPVLTGEQIIDQMAQNQADRTISYDFTNEHVDELGIKKIVNDIKSVAQNWDDPAKVPMVSNGRARSNRAPRVVCHNTYGDIVNTF